MLNRARFPVIATPVVAVALCLAACGSPPAEPTAAPPPASAPQATTRPVTPASGAPVWHYEGAEGPAQWATLSPKFAACGEGRSQSPIDISKPSAGTAPDMRVKFPPAALRIVHHEHMADGINNGHTIQINYPAADTLNLGESPYQLVQYHFHAPSEHTVSGAHFPMEMHFVHKAADGTLAVVAVFIEQGAANAAFEPVWANLPAQRGVETHLPAVEVDVDALLPSVRTSYRYDGSLTTPPCSEGVKWVIMTTPIALSTDQIGAFTRLVNHNNRPVQPLNGRTVVVDAVSETSAGS